MLARIIIKMRAALSPTSNDPIKESARILRKREAATKRAQFQVAKIQELYFDVVQSCQDFEHVHLITVISSRPRKEMKRHLDALERKLIAAQNAEAAARRNLSHARLMAGSKARRSLEPPSRG